MSFKFMEHLISPDEFKKEFPLPEDIKRIKEIRDREIADIFEGKSDKFILIIGPCSADNEEAVCDYIHRLARVYEEVKDRVFIIPRIYTNKPRTTGEGYKGMLHQPDPEQKPNLIEGLRAIRHMHLRALQDTKLTAADEMLYPDNTEYFSDVLSYIAVGARSVENQQHRLVASGLDVPVGMKNPTGGDLSVMVNSITAAQSGHTFIYGNDEVHSSGNPYAHAILRGATNKNGINIPNYHFEDMIRTYNMIVAKDIKNPSVIIDTNHSNSGKKFIEQIRIAKEVIHNKKISPELHSFVKGLMIESYIEPGSQKVGEHVYGKSITDPCLGWKDTEDLIKYIAETV